jgi:S-adenosylmethionine hydrolase
MTDGKLRFMTAVTPAAFRPSRRDPYIDFLRALSLVVVVLWHWVFTILDWQHDGPHATSPLNFTHGLWLATWLFQVMPLFFFIGGYVHLRSWERAQVHGATMGAFVWRRVRQLLIPASIVLFVWIGLGSLIGLYFDVDGVGRAVKLVISPLWFLGVYLCLIALLPVSLWLHRKAGVLALIWLAGGAMLVDVIRFKGDLESVGWVNMVLVWGLAHQAGFFYQKIVDAPRTNDWALLWTGLFGLIGLVGSGLYPGTMVGGTRRTVLQYGSANLCHRGVVAVPNRNDRAAAPGHADPPGTAEVEVVQPAAQRFRVAAVSRAHHWHGAVPVLRLGHVRHRHEGTVRSGHRLVADPAAGRHRPVHLHDSGVVAVPAPAERQQKDGYRGEPRGRDGCSVLAVPEFDYISFTTDYGLSDGFVAACHGVIARIAPPVKIIDVTHQIAPGEVTRAAAVLAQAVPHLPPAVHLAVVDPGVGTQRRAVVIRTPHALLVGPDNGVLIWAAEATGRHHRGVRTVHSGQRLPNLPRSRCLRPAAARLAIGSLAEGSAVNPADLVRLPDPVIALGEGWLESEVLTIDRFGNVQLAAPASYWEQLPNTLIVGGCRACAGRPSPTPHRVAWSCSPTPRTIWRSPSTAAGPP